MIVKFRDEAGHRWDENVFICFYYTIQWLGGSDSELGVFMFPIKWAAKELLRVSQPSSSIANYYVFIIANPMTDPYVW